MWIGRSESAHRDLVGPGKKFGVYFKNVGKPLKGLDGNIIRSFKIFPFKKILLVVVW